MQPGVSDGFEYRTWDGSGWRVSLTSLDRADPPNLGYADPDFRHVRLEDGTAHHDYKIEFFHPDGTQWVAKCLTHKDGDKIHYDFAFWTRAQYGQSMDADHHGDAMMFIAPDSSTWKASVNEQVTEDLGQTPKFTLVKI